MMRRRRRPDVAKFLEVLKDFQRRTAEYAFRRLYIDADGTRRFLVADEVGLGKTLVARGVIAKAVDHLWDKVRRIDIVYICSNADIARQNINRLDIEIPGQDGATFASRITLLPTTVKALKRNRVNFISFTPATSFDLRSSLGTAPERALLYVLLKGVWNLRGVGALKVLRGNARLDGFRNLIQQLERDDESIDPSLAAAFRRELRSRRDLRARFESLSRQFRHDRKGPPADEALARAQLVGELRSLLAATCIKALEPDLIIMDEFQRFKHLLHGDSEASRLAQQLFEYEDRTSKARVLLLSATPYKMYTLSHETGEEDHYQDFLDTLAFLLKDDDEVSELRNSLQRFRRELYRLGEEWDRAVETLSGLKGELENRLRRVMARTERLAVTEDRNGMLRQVIPLTVRLEPGDLNTYLALQHIAAVLNHGDVLEYWKTAPYLLNFMEKENYKLKTALTSALDKPGQRAALAQVLSSVDGLLVPWNAWRTYLEIDPGNARLRALLADVIDSGAWQLLWVPPSLPYYRLEGPFSDPALQNFTKRLIFSGWHVVPKTVASLVSYEAERRMIRLLENDPNEPPENSPEARRRRRPLLRFAVEADGRPSGMPVLGMLYPSTTLAREGDPLAVAAEILNERGTADRLPTLEEVLARVEQRMRDLLAPISAGHDKSEAPVDDSWYWAAPIVLDGALDGDATRVWFAPNRRLPLRWSGGEPAEAEEDGEESRWADHVEHARRVLFGDEPLGAFPDDLPKVLALMAVAAPGVATLRSLLRISGAASQDSGITLRDSAAQAAWAFRTLFNQPEVIALLRGTDTRDRPYWRRVLEYCASGGLQSVLDEYAHVLRESLGLVGKEPPKVVEQVSGATRSALTLRTANLFADDVASRILEHGSPGPYGMRVRFAVRFGDSSEDGKIVTRSTQVRDAFNSPFWPFVLVTTSIGQEGLDFHPYCHVVVHWDLPSNPVDLEQREGRVHRYKGHAIRKNVARNHSALAFARAKHGRNRRPFLDPWSALFTQAHEQRPPGSSDLIPFWLYPLPGGATIERHVPALPLSRDLDRLAALRRSLVVYRMVFGQPRQEDLLEYLLAHVPKERVKQILDELRVDLSPPTGACERS